MDAYSRRGHYIGHQLPMVIIVTGNHNSRMNVGMVHQGRFNLPQLNAKPTELYLIVQTTQTFNLAIG